MTLTKFFSFSRLPDDSSEKEGVFKTMMMLQPSKTADRSKNNNMPETTGNEAVNKNSKKKRVKVLIPKRKRQAENVKCDICGKMINFKRNMPRHMSVFHSRSDEPSFECVTCQATFASQYHLERHMASKNCVKNLDFECRKCKKKFTSSIKMTDHMKKNCPKKYMCASCFCFFKSKREYDTHLNTHES